MPRRRAAVLTGRGFAVLAGGLLMWIGSRIAGSPGLHLVAVGLIVLVLLSWAHLRWHRHRLRVTRRLSARRVFAGSTIHVTLDVEDVGGARASVIFLEDRLPAALGRAARAVLGGMGGSRHREVSYTMTCGRRGRYLVGPLVATITDPFGLARVRMEFSDRHEVIVYPRVEDLRSRPIARSAGGAGETTARQLYRRGEDFYTMREYVIGDDLRRIHWPSTARTGRLMIRQDEAARRASMTLALDTRARAFHGSAKAFERAVSAATSVGAHYMRLGISLRVSTSATAPRLLNGDAFLEAMALVDRTRHGGAAALSPADHAGGGSTLIVVTHPPSEPEATTMIRAAAGYAQRLAVLVAHGPLPDREREAIARLARAGWQTIVLPPDRKLRDLWTAPGPTAIRTAAGS